MRRRPPRPAGGVGAPGRNTPRFLPLAVLAAALLHVAPEARAQEDPPELDRQILVFLVDRVSFEELLAVEEVRALARRGGAALMSPVTPPGDLGGGAYLTLGTGIRSVGPEPRVLAFDHEEAFRGRRAAEVWSELHGGDEPPPGPFLLRPELYREANDGRSSPGLLGEILARAGRTVEVFGNADDTVGVNRPGILVAMDRRGSATAGTLRGLVVQRSGEEVPSDPARHVLVVDLGETLRIDAEAASTSPETLRDRRREALDEAGAAIRRLVTAAAAEEVLVIVVTPSPSSEMDRVKDQVTPIVVARGSPGSMFPQQGPLGTLTTDTTRRVGLVSNEDVAPSILSFFDLPVPAEMNGSAIRSVPDPPPFDLHRRHLDNRRMSVPVQVGAGIAVTVVGLASALLLYRRRWVPRRVGRLSPALPLAMVPLAVAALAAGDLPRLGYGTVAPFLAAVTVAVTLLALPLRRLGPLIPPAALGLGVLAYFSAEASSGWTATLAPFLGGSALDGARFYGLPNVDIGLLLGAAAFVAASLHPVPGFVILCFTAFLAGLPDAGANLGGALTLFAGAGLWLALRIISGPTPEAPPSMRRWVRAAAVTGVAVGVAAAGMLMVVAAHAFLADTPTHGARFAEGAAGGGLSGLWRIAVGRLAVGWRLLVDVPFAAIPVMGLPVCLWVILRARGVVGETLSRHPEWRDALIVVSVGSIVALLVNDSGPAAAGLGFGMAAAGILYLPLVEERWKPPRH